MAATVSDCLLKNGRGHVWPERRASYAVLSSCWTCTIQQLIPTGDTDLALGKLLPSPFLALRWRCLRKQNVRPVPPIPPACRHLCSVSYASCLSVTAPVLSKDSGPLPLSPTQDQHSSSAPHLEITPFPLGALFSCLHQR